MYREQLALIEVEIDGVVCCVMILRKGVITYAIKSSGLQITGLRRSKAKGATATINTGGKNSNEMVLIHR